MYENYYGFKEKPFSLTPDPRFLYLSKYHQGALDHMFFGIRQREGFMTIVGDVGTGKTTLCRCLLDRLEENVQVALVLNPMLSDVDLLRTCIQDLNIQPSLLKQKQALPFSETAFAQKNEEVSGVEPSWFWVNQLSKKELIDILNAFLLQQHQEGKFTVLIIDEAQNLSLEVMEQLRILSNLETEREKLIQIIFVGQLELNEKLSQPELNQLNQRISIRYQIKPLSKDETRNYINHRLMVAGASSRICFSSSAINAIYNYALGYPRLINLVTDRALLAGFNVGVDTLKGCHVKEGIRSLLGKEEKRYFLKNFVKNKLALVASLFFFLASLAVFWKSSNIYRQGFIREESVSKTFQASAEVSIPVVVKDKGSTMRKSLTPLPVVVSKQTYEIQVYKMSSTNSAKDSVRLLESEGYPAFFRGSKKDGKTWYLVYAGPYDTKDSAGRALHLLKHSGRKAILFSRKHLS